MSLWFMTLSRTIWPTSRQGTQSALTRAEVSGGGSKPWRQKGTGRARQGSTRAPQWTHGGIVFAPKPRDYSYTLNKKAKRLALKSVAERQGFRGRYRGHRRHQDGRAQDLQVLAKLPEGRRRAKARLWSSLPTPTRTW